MNDAESHPRFYEQCVRFLEAGKTVVVSQDRLRRHLERTYHQNMAQRLEKSQAKTMTWAAPKILTELTWLRTTYEQLSLFAPWDRPLPRLLSDRQAQAVWWQEISQAHFQLRQNSKSDPGEPLPDILIPQGAAERARQARRILKLLQQELWPSGLYYSQDPELYSLYHQRLESRLKQEHWIEVADVADWIVTCFREETFPRMALPQPGSLVFVGFEEIWPQTRRLLEVLEGEVFPTPTAGSFVSSTVRLSSDSPSHIEICTVETVDQETEAACLWAASLLESWSQTEGVDLRHPPRIGIAVLNLSQRLTQFERILSHLLDSQSLTFQSSQSSLDARRQPFALSQPRPLLSFEPVRIALSLLRLRPDFVEARVLSTLIRSPFLRIAGKQRPRVFNREPRMREDWPETLPWIEAIKQLERNGLSHAAMVLSELLKKRAYDGQRRCLGDWVRCWAEVLSDANWPKSLGVDLDSHTYQIVQRFQNILRDLATLELVQREPMESDRALDQLETLLRTTPFQPEGSGGPIEVFDLTESYGLTFDGIFICGLTDDAWPPSAEAHPFIPIQELLPPENGGRSNQVCPRATAAATRAWAQTLTHHLITCAPQVVIGKAAVDTGQGRQLRPSPLIREILDSSKQWMAAAGYELNPLTPLMKKFQEQRTVLSWTPEVPFPIEGEEAERVTGGAYLLRSVSTCPVKAQLEYRLNLKRMEEPTPGFGPKEMGTAVHAAVEWFWKNLPKLAKESGPASSKMLANLMRNEKGFRNAVAQAVDHILGTPQQASTDCFEQEPSELNSSHPERFVGDPKLTIHLSGLPAEYGANLRNKLQRLVSLWLTKEASLERSFMILGLELEETYEAGGLKLSLKVDRIDENQAMGEDTPSVTLVDYKSSVKSLSQAWFGDRPAEPQLPLYSHILRSKGRTIEEMAFAVVAEPTTYQKGVPKWQSLGKKLTRKELHSWLRSPKDGGFLLGTGILTIDQVSPLYDPSDSGKASDEVHDWEKAFEALMKHYSHVIPELVKTYTGGSPILDPLPLKSPKADKALKLACEFCDMKALCRIGELRRFVAPDLAEDDEDGLDDLEDSDED